jgi:hypothetical protein
MARKPRAASAAPKDTTTPGVDQSAPVTTFENSPEFQAAVASAVAKAVPALIPALREQILQNLGTARGDAPAVPGDHLWADALAMSIAQITDQGTGRKTVAPAVLKARSEARALMVQLIVEARAAGQIPRYTLKHKVYLDEVLVDPIWVGSDHIQRPTGIEWPGVPNEAMQPANDVAEGIFKAFSDSIGTLPANHQQPERENKVTPGGLVVHGRPIARPAASAEPSNGLSGEGGLRIAHLERPGAHKEVRVLGTVAPAARQQA